MWSCEQLDRLTEKSVAGGSRTPLLFQTNYVRAIASILPFRTSDDIHHNTAPLLVSTSACSTSTASGPHCAAVLELFNHLPASLHTYVGADRNTCTLFFTKISLRLLVWSCDKASAFPMTRHHSNTLASKGKT